MDIDHVNVKILATPDSNVNWPNLVPVFHRWIRENVLPGTLIDVADYEHVPEGPGVMLIGHDAFYSVDNRRNTPGFLYNRRTPDARSTPEKIRHAYESALEAARQLEQAPEIQGLQFDEKRFEIFINDRMLAPNTAETENELRPVVEALYNERFGAPPVIERESEDPRTLFRLRVKPA